MINLSKNMQIEKEVSALEKSSFSFHKSCPAKLTGKILPWSFPRIYSRQTLTQ